MDTVLPSIPGFPQEKTARETPSRKNTLAGDALSAGGIDCSSPGRNGETSPGADRSGSENPSPEEDGSEKPLRGGRAHRPEKKVGGRRQVPVLPGVAIFRERREKGTLLPEHEHRHLPEGSNPGNNVHIPRGRSLHGNDRRCLSATCPRNLQTGSRVPVVQSGRPSPVAWREIGWPFPGEPQEEAEWKEPL